MSNEPVQLPSLWEHDNLLAWCVVRYDDMKRGPQERAQMLERLGFRHYAYDWPEINAAIFDAEIEALQNRQIDLTACWFSLEADDPGAKAILETFKRHNIHPQLWVPLFADDVLKAVNAQVKMMPKPAEWQKLSDAKRKHIIAKLQKSLSPTVARDFPKTAEEQERRVIREANRLNALVKLAAPYGCKIMLYNHNAWAGMIENQVAVIERLAALGVTDIGIVYNFRHARDEFHDDSKNFPALWEKMKAHVVVVNVTGMQMEGLDIYPSQGNGELEMMHTIEASGWQGRVGLIAEKGGDAEITLKNYITGLDWLAAEIRQPGSGGPRPFAQVL